jgi:hypothetical protein
MENEEPKMPAFYREYLDKQMEFETVTYPKMTWDEKINFWVSDIHRMMRSSGESMGDEYRGFKLRSYQEWKKVEPRIDEILAILKDRLEYFDEQEMWSRIGR